MVDSSGNWQSQLLLCSPATNSNRVALSDSTLTVRAQRERSCGLWLWELQISVRGRYRDLGKSGIARVVASDERIDSIAFELITRLIEFEFGGGRHTIGSDPAVLKSTLDRSRIKWTLSRNLPLTIIVRFASYRSIFVARTLKDQLRRKTDRATFHATGYTRSVTLRRPIEKNKVIIIRVYHKFYRSIVRKIAKLNRLVLRERKRRAAINIRRRGWEAQREKSFAIARNFYVRVSFSLKCVGFLTVGTTCDGGGVTWQQVTLFWPGLGGILRRDRRRRSSPLLSGYRTEVSNLLTGLLHLLMRLSSAPRLRFQVLAKGDEEASVRLARTNHSRKVKRNVEERWLALLGVESPAEVRAEVDSCGSAVGIHGGNLGYIMLGAGFLCALLKVLALAGAVVAFLPDDDENVVLASLQEECASKCPDLDLTQVRVALFSFSLALTRCRAVVAKGETHYRGDGKNSLSCVTISRKALLRIEKDTSVRFVADLCEEKLSH